MSYTNKPLARVMVVLALILGNTVSAVANASEPGSETSPAWLERAVTPIDLARRDPDLTVLDEALNGADIIGLGESTHGQSEVFQAKDSIIRHLVINQNARQIIYEMSVGEGALLNQYVIGERDDLAGLLSGLSLWMFQTEEFAEHLRWLRRYNDKGSEEDRVTLHGMESQYADRSAFFALKIVDRIEPKKGQEFAERFGPERIASPTSSAEDFVFLYSPISDESYRAYLNLCLDLRLFIAEQDKSDSNPTTDLTRHTESICQFVSMSLLDSSSAQAQLRDYVMAVNVAQIHSQSEGAKTVVWGHNQHIWEGVGNGGYDVLGKQLDRWFGERYYAIGFDFGSGEYRAPSNDGFLHSFTDPDPATLSGALLALGKPDAFVELQDFPHNGSPDYRSTYRVRASAGGYAARDEYADIDVVHNYDALIYLAKTSASKPLL
ncbi:MAG: erythromycin esterase family protein [Pseudomonadota bacterium]